MPGSSTAWSRRSMRFAARSKNLAGLRPYVESATGSSHRTELTATLHRLRSTLARSKAELELDWRDGTVPPSDRLLTGLDDAFALENAVDTARQAATPVTAG